MTKYKSDFYKTNIRMSETRDSIYYPGSPYKVIMRYGIIDRDEMGGWSVFEVEELSSTKHKPLFYPFLHDLNIIVVNPRYSKNLPLVRFSVPAIKTYQKSKIVKPKKYRPIKHQFVNESMRKSA